MKTEVLVKTVTLRFKNKIKNIMLKSFFAFSQTDNMLIKIKKRDLAVPVFEKKIKKSQTSPVSNLHITQFSH